MTFSTVNPFILKIRIVQSNCVSIKVCISYLYNDNSSLVEAIHLWNGVPWKCTCFGYPYLHRSSSSYNGCLMYTKCVSAKKSKKMKEEKIDNFLGQQRCYSMLYGIAILRRRKKKRFYVLSYLSTRSHTHFKCNIS